MTRNKSQTTPIRYFVVCLHDCHVTDDVMRSRDNVKVIVSSDANDDADDTDLHCTSGHVLTVRRLMVGMVVPASDVE